VSALDSFLVDAVPVCSESDLRALAYKALLTATAELRIYDLPGELQLDECRLSRELGVSRTPIREALTILEHQGFVRRRPRHGVFVVKKTRREIIDEQHHAGCCEHTDRSQNTECDPGASRAERARQSLLRGHWAPRDHAHGVGTVAYRVLIGPFLLAETAIDAGTVHALVKVMRTERDA
jgi:Fe2+ or Zn2+ uptake regulation protein